MARDYKENAKAFATGDIVILEGKHRCKILAVMQDEDNNFWYEVEGIDLLPPVRLLTREVPQSALEKI